MKLLNNQKAYIFESNEECSETIRFAQLSNSDRKIYKSILAQNDFQAIAFYQFQWVRKYFGVDKRGTHKWDYCSKAGL